MRLPTAAFLFICLPCLSSLAQEGTVLTTAAEIAQHPSTNPLEQPPVRLEATVIHVDPGGTVFLQDDSGASFIRSSENGKNFQPGQQVLVGGTRYPGLYIGGIIPDRITLLGTVPLPLPRSVSMADLRSGRFHYSLVQIEGVGRKFTARGEDGASLQVNVDGETLELRFEQAPPDPSQLIDARLQVQGLAAGVINDRRQLLTPYLLLRDLAAVQILTPAPADAFSGEVAPVSALPSLLTAGASLHRVKVRGVALSGQMQGRFFLRDGERSLQVLTSQSGALTPGDEVEAVGFVEMGSFSARLADAAWQVNGGNVLPVPLRPDAKQLASGSTDAELVTLEARVVQWLDEGRSFLAQCGPHPVKVISENGTLPSLTLNSTLQLTGLCLVTATQEQGYRANATGFEILLRSPQDLYVIAAPPWWTATRLTLALGLVALLALLALAWAALLKRQVSGQLAVIESKVQREAVMEERQRIAREFHDTLEQELAGLSLRLDAATPRVQDDKARGLLEQLRRLLLRLQTETRDFVWDLRDAMRIEAPLPEALAALIDHLQSTTNVPLSCKAEVNVPAVSALTQHHLLRLTREAVQNAIKHSQASVISVTLQDDGKQLRLSITDDGLGFEKEDSALAGHFGLQGMKERARKLRASLQFHSRRGSGTKVEVLLAHEPVQP